MSFGSMIEGKVVPQQHVTNVVLLFFVAAALAVDLFEYVEQCFLLLPWLALDMFLCIKCVIA